MFNIFDFFLNIFDKRPWTIIVTTTGAFTDKTSRRIQWIQPGTRKEAVDAAKHLNIYYNSDYFVRQKYEAIPVEDLLKQDWVKEN